MSLLSYEPSASHVKVPPEFNVVGGSDFLPPDELCQELGLCTSVLACSCTAFGGSASVGYPSRPGGSYWTSTTWAGRPTFAVPPSLDAEANEMFTVAFDRGQAVDSRSGFLAPVNEVRAVRGPVPVAR